MLRGLKITGLGLLGLLLAIMAFAYWALDSQTGSRWVLAQVPGLQVDGFEGELAGVAHDGAGGALDLFGFGDWVFRGGAEFAELSGGDENTFFVGADGVVVAANRGVETLADFVEVSGHGAQAIVEFLAQIADLLCVLGELLLAPAIGDGFE